MKFKTTIKIITEAADKNEAMEIAGEYLSGNLATGVDMRFRTVCLHSNKQRSAAALTLALLLALLTAHLSSVKYSQHSSIRNLPGDSVIQPPLKTSSDDKKNFDFKKEWQAKRVREALDFLKK
ncbi:MAG: hypothetical protein Q7S07_05710 [Candidatus Omnitrophota bacterium]|nr:hypothetical protein [Candidatus Omnitrophota bacterium]